MPGLRVKTVRKELADGTQTTYRYANGVRLRGEPGSDEYNRSLWKAAHSARAGNDRVQTLRDLLEDFRRSPEFAASRGKWTRYQRERAIRHIAAKLGNIEAADLNNERIIDVLHDYRDGMADKPAMADYRIATLKLALAWAVKRRKIKVNHAAGIEKLHRSGDRSKKILTPDMLDHLTPTMTQEEQDLVGMALLTGARSADMAALEWENLKDGWLCYQPTKTEGSTGVVVELPVFALPALESLLERLPRRSERILTTETRTPWTSHNITRRWRLAIKRAFGEDIDRHFHDLRGTCATRLFNAGCTEIEVAAITGHSFTKGSLGKYASPNREHAENAYRKLARYLDTERGKVVAFKRA